MDLTHHFLIAMPYLNDSFFSHSVVYLCHHSADGAFGLIINHPLPEVSFDELCQQLKIDNQREDTPAIFFGGPVQRDQGMVLHDYEKIFQATQDLAPPLYLSASRDILEALAVNQLPGNFFISLGYAGWSPGQLEEELHSNSWLHVAAKPELIFQVPPKKRWEQAVGLLGVDPKFLTGSKGHA